MDKLSFVEGALRWKNRLSLKESQGVISSTIRTDLYESPPDRVRGK